MRSEQVSEHQVTIHVEEPDDPDTFGLDLIEDPIADALDTSGAGVLDGHDIGSDGAVIYLYGPDADRIHEAITPALRDSPIPAGSYLIRRYGGPGARETRLDLS